jgi:hypothetical protein
LQPIGTNKTFDSFFRLILLPLSSEIKSNSNNRMQVKGLQITFKCRLSGWKGNTTGNGLVIVPCLNGVFPCLFTAFPICLPSVLIAGNQIVCFGLRKTAFEC